MICIEQFERMADTGEFAALFASFGKHLPVPNRVVGAWFRELESCDYNTVIKAFEKLKRGDKFPNFGMFWAVYHSLNASGREERTDFCGNCHDGKVIGKEWSDFYLMDIEVVALCGECHPGNKHAVSPFNPNINWTLPPAQFNARKKEADADHRKELAKVRAAMGISKPDPINEATRERNLKVNG